MAKYTAEQVEKIIEYSKTPHLFCTLEDNEEILARLTKQHNKLGGGCLLIDCIGVDKDATEPSKLYDDVHKGILYAFKNGSFLGITAGGSNKKDIIKIDIVRMALAEGAMARKHPSTLEVLKDFVKSLFGFKPKPFIPFLVVFRGLSNAHESTRKLAEEIVMQGRALGITTIVADDYYNMNSNTIKANTFQVTPEQLQKQLL